MENLAIQLKEEAVIQDYGLVTGSSGHRFTIETTSGTWQARPAVSCLLQPEIGDLVLLTAHSAYEAYILAVLERQTDATAELLFERDITITSRGGQINLVSRQDINIIPKKRLQIISGETGIHTQKAEITIDEMSFWGKFLDANVKSIRLLANGFESVIHLLRQKLSRSYRTIEEVEHVKADRYDCHARSLLSLKGKYSTITANEDVKIDAERIHIG